MTKRAYIIHGWGGDSEEAWFPWLKKELSARGFEVSIPAMPNTDEPDIDAWVGHLTETIGIPDEQTYLVGHSIGCQTILRYLALRDGTKIGGIVCVAGWFSLMNLESVEEERIAKPWLELPIDFDRVKAAVPKIVAIFSDDDPVIPLESNVKDFKEKLGAEIIVESGKGHFSRSDKVTELPSVLSTLVKMVE